MSTTRWLYAKYTGNQTFSTEEGEFYILGDLWEEFQDTGYGCLPSDSNCYSVYYRILIEGNQLKDIEMSE